MALRPDALQHLSFNWFAIVMSVAGLALAWLRAVPVLGELAGAGALVLALLAALAFGALALFSWIRWQVQAQAVADELAHPARHAFLGAVPVSLLLLATAGVSLLGTNAWLAAVWWTGSLLQWGVTVWVLVRWLRVDRNTGLNWPALTPVLFIPVVGNVLAPLAGGALGAGDWAAAQFGVGVLLWPVVLALLLVRVATQGLWPERLLPATFIAITPPALIGSGVLQLGGPPVLAWMCWGVALLFLLACGSLGRRILAQPFTIGFWAIGFPLSAFAALTLRLVVYQPALQPLAMLALALASLAVLLLALSSWKSWQQGSLLVPDAPPPALSVTATRSAPRDG
ncbi:MAG TPA: C4-dicarboxylate ABC transporter [Ottowia sp.]|uniref:SLAC1 family transporter n=1 Tax=Ottowia sp. TaxID=1898956 RepID=UPI002C245C17|nr:C4-dicarboxylate ABC transporter [Ottowia sp.]HMN20821.1 C4-dicarboxylate ABC transporter [Ottowia sp.]